MDKDRGLEDKERILSARGLMREVTDVNMKRIRARLAEHGASADSSIFLRHQVSKGKGRCKNP